ncbi:protein FAR1-RELATED SEQUENCE 5-like [Silene latifolia]|uniref:protein FAR1-RELATED SEQUENCE 5-like n=1 Tax=Silene latifolia TaxID=37657 RepID=UPI003D77B071
MGQLHVISHNNHGLGVDLAIATTSDVDSRVLMEIKEYDNLVDPTGSIVLAANNELGQISSELGIDSPVIPLNYKERIPVCAPNLKPNVGMSFENLVGAKQFYKTYAANARFKMRKSTQRIIDGVVMTKNCVCSLAGESKPRGKRDVKQFIKGYDAQMMIENFTHKKAMCNFFFFDFDVDERGRLSRGIWADPISIKNYILFGDMTSFDTTFNMNTYKMIFAPFTGVDNHKKCVTFAAGLLRNEFDEGFAWLFQYFLAATGGKYPKCIITDQDAGIKAGVKKVFKDKTYHRNLFLGGLMRTTSRSESENSLFGNFMKPNLTLVEFLMRFESAIDAQRWKQSKLIVDSKNSFPSLETPHSLDKHASVFYTLIIFSEFQVEWNAACFTCGVKVLGVHTTDNIPIYDRERNKVYYVCFIPDGVKLSYSCKKFERHEVQKIKLGNLWSELFSCVTIAEQKPKYIDELMDILKGLKDIMLSESSSSECSSGVTCEKSRNKNKELEMLLGTTIPTEVTVLNPIQSKTKGSGKRTVSRKDKAVQEYKKAPRKCNACGDLGFHDSRNCPRRAYNYEQV